MIISRGMRLALPIEVGMRVGMFVQWRVPALFETYDSRSLIPRNPFVSIRQGIIESLTDSQANVRVILESTTVPHNKGW